MGNVRTPSGIKLGLNNTCKKAAKKLSKLAPGKKSEKWVVEKLTSDVCKDVDQKILALAFKELAKYAKGRSAKAKPGTPPKIKGIPSLKDPAPGVPTLTVPIGSIDLGLGDKSKGEFEIKVWGDPKEFEDSTKGAALYFKVNF